MQCTKLKTANTFSEMYFSHITARLLSDPFYVEYILSKYSSDFKRTNYSVFTEYSFHDMSRIDILVEFRTLEAIYIESKLHAYNAIDQLNHYINNGDHSKILGIQLVPFIKQANKILEIDNKLKILSLEELINQNNISPLRDTAEFILKSFKAQLNMFSVDDLDEELSKLCGKEFLELANKYPIEFKELNDRGLYSEHKDNSEDFLFI